MNWGLFFCSLFNDMMQRFIDRGSALIRLRDLRAAPLLQRRELDNKIMKGPSPLAKPPGSSSLASCTTSALHVLHCCQEFNNDTLFAYINLFKKTH